MSEEDRTYTEQQRNAVYMMRHHERIPGTDRPLPFRVISERLATEGGYGCEPFEVSAGTAKVFYYRERSRLFTRSMRPVSKQERDIAQFARAMRDLHALASEEREIVTGALGSALGYISADAGDNDEQAQQAQRICDELHRALRRLEKRP